MTIQEQNGRIILQPEGELTIFEAADFRQALLGLSEKPGDLELNLANVSRMDSSGVQLVVSACQEMILEVTNVPSAVKEQFEVIGCGKFLEGPAISSVMKS
ncbi:STAS domain-containing protein [Candidatus Nitronereus thalassa]|uniref:STAS domain-containing protein n=1 Tax=Candidatus Nitronereus thalassa TaxID=3020898 RepID=A0ABU3K678_9BACT|nr:STAS domain-containing protein [Candidatus Nitronereus thalassa]MDT7041898.1 STAS domain-containing protein [Candidatus Nitronereus thalassa]